jgi:hypothetical protein
MPYTATNCAEIVERVNGHEDGPQATAAGQLDSGLRSPAGEVVAVAEACIFLDGW